MPNMEDMEKNKQRGSSVERIFCEVEQLVSGVVPALVAAWSPTPEKQTVLNQTIAQHIDFKILYAQYAKQSKLEPASSEAWMRKHPGPAWSSVTTQPHNDWS